VTNALITADLHLALDVLRDVAAKIALDLDVLFDEDTDLAHLFVGEITNTGVACDVGAIADDLGHAPTHPVEVCERDFDSLFARNVDSDDTCHRSVVSLTLTLFMSGVGADDCNPPAPSDDSALVAHRFHARTNLHCDLSLLLVAVSDAAAGEVVGVSST